MPRVEGQQTVVRLEARGRAEIESRLAHPDAQKALESIERRAIELGEDGFSNWDGTTGIRTFDVFGRDRVVLMGLGLQVLVYGPRDVHITLARDARDRHRVVRLPPQNLLGDPDWFRLEVRNGSTISAVREEIEAELRLLGESGILRKGTSRRTSTGRSLRDVKMYLARCRGEAWESIAANYGIRADSARRRVRKFCRDEAVPKPSSRPDLQALGEEAAATCRNCDPMCDECPFHRYLAELDRAEVPQDHLLGTSSDAGEWS